MFNILFNNSSLDDVEVTVFSGAFLNLVLPFNIFFNNSSLGDAKLTLLVATVVNDAFLSLLFISFINDIDDFCLFSSGNKNDGISGGYGIDFLSFNTTEEGLSLLVTCGINDDDDEVGTGAGVVIVLINQMTMMMRLVLVLVLML